MTSKSSWKYGKTDSGAVFSTTKKTPTIVYPFSWFIMVSGRTKPWKSSQNAVLSSKIEGSPFLKKTRTIHKKMEKWHPKRPRKAGESNKKCHRRASGNTLKKSRKKNTKKAGKKPVLAWEREARLKEKRCRDCVQKGSQNHSKSEPWTSPIPKVSPGPLQNK